MNIIAYGFIIFALEYGCCFTWDARI